MFEFKPKYVKWYVFDLWVAKEAVIQNLNVCICIDNRQNTNTGCVAHCKYFIPVFKPFDLLLTK